MTNEGKNPQYDREDCYFCNDPHDELLETHHIVPRRYDGSDGPENLVAVCPTCHRKLERLYDKRFFSALGVESGAGGYSDREKNSGMSEEKRERLRIAKARVSEVGEDYMEGAPAQRVVRTLVGEGYTEEEAEVAIENLKQKGEVYEPAEGTLRAT